MSSRADPISPALEAVIERSAEHVRRIGGRHGLSASDVDVLFQEVRVRLWKALATGERIGEARASYVYMTATTAALDLIRRRRSRREQDLDDARESSWMESPAPSPLAQAEASETAAMVADAVDELIESRRPVVKMYLTGYNTREIADLMGWTEAKARNLLYRGMADLRERLRDRGLGPEQLSEAS
jgi:RNA polymerase sigma factor (sigma-70 family)